MSLCCDIGAFLYVYIEREIVRVHVDKSLINYPPQFSSNLLNQS